MKNHFEDKIKEKMNQLSLEESGLNPDMDAVWNKIKNKNNSTASRRVKFKSLISHAAAVLVGIIISATLLLSIFNKKNIEENNQFARSDSPKATSIKTINNTDTIFIEKTIVKIKKQNNLEKIKITKQVIDKTEIEINDTKSLQNDNELAVSGNLQQRNEENIVSIQSPKASKQKGIVYWSDIQSNYHNTPSEEKKNIIAQILKTDKPENESSNNTTTISPFLAFSKSFKNN